MLEEKKIWSLSRAISIALLGGSAAMLAACGGNGNIDDDINDPPPIGGGDGDGNGDGGNGDGGNGDGGNGDGGNGGDGEGHPDLPATEGTFRVDAAGNVTKNGSIMPVQCGSWFGLEGRHEPDDDPDNPGGAPMELFVGNMWWANDGQGTGRTIQQTMDEIKELGINTIRLPIAPQTLDASDPQGSGSNVLKNHESVRQTNARQAMEDFIVLADQNDLNVLVGIHSCSNYLGWRAGRLDANPPYADADRLGYDFLREDYSCGGGAINDHPYNESRWLEDLKTIAGLQDALGVSNIIGIDIFNEPWDYTWEEWKTLAEKGYEAIDSVNSDVLVYVQGVGSLTSAGEEIPHGDEGTNPNWGENLYEAWSNPPNIPKDRLVYSPHVYGPSVFVQNHFLADDCDGLEGHDAGAAGCTVSLSETALRAGWDEHFGYLRDHGFAMVIGEYGGNMDWPLATTAAEGENWSHQPTGTDEQWQNMFVDYMIEKGIQGCYWSINPESSDTWGIYGHAYEADVNEGGWGEWESFDTRKSTLLQRLWSSN